MERSTLPGPATRKILLMERFETLKNIILEEYGEDWARDWECLDSFPRPQQRRVKCVHTRLESLIHSLEFCRECSGIPVSKATYDKLTAKKHLDVVRELERRGGYWLHWWDVNGERVDIDCRHKILSIDHEVLCVSCCEILESAPRHKIRTQRRRRSVERELKHFQGLNNRPNIKPETLTALRDVTTKRGIKETLKKLGLTKLLGQVHHLHHELTGIPKNNIREYENILDAEMKTIATKWKVRLDKQFLMMLLLESHGEKFDRSEFTFSKKMWKYEAELRKFIDEI